MELQKTWRKKNYNNKGLGGTKGDIVSDGKTDWDFLLKEEMKNKLPFSAFF